MGVLVPAHEIPTWSQMVRVLLAQAGQSIKDSRAHRTCNQDLTADLCPSLFSERDKLLLDASRLQNEAEFKVAQLLGKDHLPLMSFF